MAEHIKIPAQTPVISYVGNGSTFVFVIPFTFFAVTDIVAKINGVVQGGNYTVFPTGGFDKGFPGGQLHFTSPPAAGAIIVIERHLPLERTVDFPPSGPLQTAALNTELDKAVARDQQIEAEIVALDTRIDILELGDPRIGRAMLFPPEDVGISKTLPGIGDRAQQVLGFDPGGNIAMFSALLDPAAARNVVLPVPAGRQNKVLGWDSSGVNFAMLDVVSGTLIPDSASINYVGIPGSLGTRSVQDRLRERISIKDFGANVGEGFENSDTDAFNQAMIYINALPDVSITLYFPDGIYFLSNQAVALTKSNTVIEGSGSTTIVFTGTGVWLTITGVGGSQVKNVSLRDFVFDCSSAPDGAALCHLENSFNCWFEDIQFVNADCFLHLGNVTLPAAQGGAFLTNCINCRGTSRGVQPLFQVKAGGGLFIHNNQFQVNHAAPTPLSCRFIDATVIAFTLVRVINCDVVGFGYFLYIDCNGGGSISDVIVANCRATVIQNTNIFIQHGNGGSIFNIRVTNNNLDCTDGHCILILDQGGATFCENLQFNHNLIGGAGFAAFVAGSRSNTVSFSFNYMMNLNRLAGASLAAVHIYGGTGFVIEGNSGNWIGTRCPYGLFIAAGVYFYQVSNNRLLGATNSYVIPNDGAVNPYRRCHNNLFAEAAYFGGYAGMQGVPFDGNGIYYNTTPFTEEFYLTVQLSAVYVQGTRILFATTSAFTCRVEPGEQLYVPEVAAGSVAVIKKVLP